MSAPVREPDDGPSKERPLNYAPKKIRYREPHLIPAGAHREGDAASQDTTLESGQPPRKRSKQRGSFAGDVAIAELRNRFALAPDPLPPPPPPPSTGSKFGLASRLAGLAVVTAVGAVAYRMGSGPPASLPQLALGSGQSNQQGLVSKRSVPAALPLQSAPPPFGPTAAAKVIVPQSDERNSRDAVPTASPRLTVGAVGRQQADEAARLTVSAADAGADAAVVIRGLAPGSALSVGTQAGPSTWRLSTQGLNETAIMPPGNFVGAMDLTLELRLADNTVADRKSLRLEWSPKSAPASAESQLQRLAASEIELMVRRGAEYMANGNVGAARMIFLPAAEAGDSVAAFALAETYDPLVLRKLNAKGGIAGDISLAQTWYEKAKDLGSAIASERLARLARLPE
jgi:TPR repeat protein